MHSILIKKDGTYFRWWNWEEKVTDLLEVQNQQDLVKDYLRGLRKKQESSLTSASSLYSFYTFFIQLQSIDYDTNAICDYETLAKTVGTWTQNK